MSFQRIWLLLLVVGLIVIASRKAIQGEAAPVPAAPIATPAVQAR